MTYRMTLPIILQNGLRFRAEQAPLFDYMRNYFNRFVGREIYRRQMMMDIIGAGYKNKNTIDTYRSYFTGAGYLMIIDRGYYHVLKEIPHGMMLADLRWEASRKRKEWEENKVTRKMYVKKMEFIKENEFNV